MSSRSIDDFTAAWTPDGSGLWTATATASATHLGADASGMEIRAVAGPAAAPAPSAERQFAHALDLRDADELRLWLRSTRSGDGSAGRPLFLALEATRNPPTAALWQRLLPVRSTGAWELHRLWLGDMPATLRRSVGILRLRSLDGRLAFTAELDDLLAVRPEPIADVETALLARLDGVYSVDVAGVATAVPALLDVPENPGTRTEPYVLVTPWSAIGLGPRTGRAEVVDNYTPSGGHVRSAPTWLALEYRIDVHALERGHKQAVLDGLLVDMLRPLVVAGVPFEIAPFDAGTAASADAPGRTPLFYRIVVPAETGTPEFHDSAAPFLLVGELEDRSAPEAVHVP